MRKIRQIILLLSISVTTLNIYAQNEINLEVPRIVPMSPTATAIEKYHSYPVDYSTGVPDITIPLYEIVSGEVTIPVTLKYHASGLKPKEQSGVVGTGWSLKLEPSVTRQVNGVADEWDKGWFSGAQNNPNLYGYDCVSLLRYYNDKANNKIDTQPDKFSYTLANGGGSGFFPNAYSPLNTVPYNSDRVEFSEGGAGIDITDGNGVKYKFYGNYEKSGDIKTRWLCNSIWSPQNPSTPSITFGYGESLRTTGLSTLYNLDNKIIGTSSSNYPYILVEQWESPINKCFTISAPNSSGNEIPEALVTPISQSNAGVNYPILSRYVKDDIYITRLDNVKFQGNRLDISYKGVGVIPYNSTVLETIEVTDEKEAIVRTIKFYITPYNSGTSLTKLDSVVISGPGVEPQKYTFNYYNRNFVPSVYTVAVDHWGFCNGPYTGSNNSTVPSFKKLVRIKTGATSSQLVWFNYSGINREPNHEWTRTGILTQIINPQGIEANFVYEGNYGAFRDNNYNKKEYLHPVGGLRIKRIETIDPKTGKRNYKDYKYGLTKPEVIGYEPIWGGGAIKHIVTIGDYGSPIWGDDIPTIGSMPIANISFNNGSAVLYNIVTEEIGSWTSGHVLKTNYYYKVKPHNFEDVLKLDRYNSAELYISDLARNIIVEKNKQGGNQYLYYRGEMEKLVRREPSHPSEPSDDFVDHDLSTNQFDGKLIRTEYFKDAQLVSSTDYIYDQKRICYKYTPIDLPLGSISEERLYYYLTHPSECPSPSSLFTYGKYSWDPNSKEPQTSYYLDHTIFSPLDKEITKEYHYNNGRQDIVTTEKKYDYNINCVLAETGVSLKPERIETTNSDNTVIIDSLHYLTNYPNILSRQKHIENNSWKESRILFKSNSNLPERVQFRTDKMPAFRDEVLYNAYDNYGNVTEIMGKDGTPISILWGYRRQFPVAKIENATIEQVYAALRLYNNGSRVYEDWPDSAEPVSDMWKYINSLRNDLPNARVSIYEYKPLQGVVSITDPNNITTKFVYDNYSRLTDSYFLDVKSSTDIRRVILEKYIYNFGK
ncbi:MAG: hypothetical protein ACK5KT_02475 [Dysgonomonas sp.]